MLWQMLIFPENTEPLLPSQGEELLGFRAASIGTKHGTGVLLDLLLLGLTCFDLFSMLSQMKSGFIVGLFCFL